jgi:hypothetical protein
MLFLYQNIDQLLNNTTSRIPSYVIPLMILGHFHESYNDPSIYNCFCNCLFHCQPITVTTTCPTNNCHIQETRSTVICMQLMPISPRAYLKPYYQHHKHMPLPRMYQHHHIPSQDMCLNQVPTYTMHQPCINLYLYHQQVHQPCTKLWK